MLYLSSIKWRFCFEVFKNSHLYLLLKKCPSMSRVSSLFVSNQAKAALSAHFLVGLTEDVPGYEIHLLTHWCALRSGLTHSAFFFPLLKYKSMIRGFIDSVIYFFFNCIRFVALLTLELGWPPSAVCLPYPCQLKHGNGAYNCSTAS